MLFRQTEIGKIPENWSVSTLEEISEQLTDGSHFSPREMPDGDKIIATVRDMRDNGFDFTDSKRISSQDFSRLVRDGCSPRRGDILISKDGANCLDLIFVYDQHEEIVLLSSIAIVRLKHEYNPYFYRYYLLSPRTQKFMREGFVTGSAIPRVVLKNFRKIPVPIPDIDTQSSIAKILWSLDSKIEGNKKTNRLLGEVGQSIFKRWFVDFEFPNEEGKPYKSSGGEMAESEKGEIPKGWRTTELKNLGRIVCGKTPPKANKEYFGGKVPFIKIPDMHNQLFIINTEDTLTDEGERYQVSKSVPANSICVSCIATVGLVSITSRQSQTNQQINCVVPHDEFYLPYLFYTLKSLKKELEELGSGGSATLNVNTNTFSNIRMIDPKTEIVREFYRIAAPLLLKLRANLIENHTLSQIRDCLLPKLMSGKIRVPV